MLLPLCTWFLRSEPRFYQINYFLPSFLWNTRSFKAALTDDVQSKPHCCLFPGGVCCITVIWFSKLHFPCFSLDLLQRVCRGELQELRFTQSWISHQQKYFDLWQTHLELCGSCAAWGASWLRAVTWGRGGSGSLSSNLCLWLSLKGRQPQKGDFGLLSNAVWAGRQWRAVNWKFVFFT